MTLFKTPDGSGRHFNIRATSGWDTFLSIVLSQRGFARHVAKKLAGRFTSFTLPDGSTWSIEKDQSVIPAVPTPPEEPK